MLRVTLGSEEIMEFHENHCFLHLYKMTALGISNWRFLAGHQGSGQGSHQGSPGRRKPLFRGWQPGRAPPLFSKQNKQYSSRNTHCFASSIFIKHEKEAAILQEYALETFFKQIGNAKQCVFLQEYCLFYIFNENERCNTKRIPRRMLLLFHVL